jgi:hypothetical protein
VLEYGLNFEFVFVDIRILNFKILGMNLIEI